MKVGDTLTTVRNNTLRNSDVRPMSPDSVADERLVAGCREKNLVGAVAFFCRAYVILAALASESSRAIGLLNQLKFAHAHRLGGKS
jgi:hypothetical protein